MNNPRKILSKEDIDILESNKVNVPDKELNDKEWDNFIVQIAINLKQEESERIIYINNKMIFMIFYLCCFKCGNTCWRKYTQLNIKHYC